MAIYISNPPYSFVQFEFPTNNSAGNALVTEAPGLLVITTEDGQPLVVQGDVGGGSVMGSSQYEECLPINKQNDIAFQLIIDTDTVQEAEYLEDNPTAFKLLLIEPNKANNQALILANVIHDYSTNALAFEVYRVGEKKLVIYWPNGLPLFINHLRYDLLRLAVQVTLNGSDYVKPSTLLHFNTSIYTSAIEYSCDEDSFEFIYCASHTPNKVRLPFYLKNLPQFQDEESIYQRSDGSIKLLKSVTKKEYQGITDYLNAGQHEKLKIALSHDTVEIDSKNYTGAIRKNGSYEIDPVDIPGDIEVAQAKFKALVTPYNVRNSNCEKCNACNITLGNFNIVYEGLFTGHPYFTITWDIVTGTLLNTGFLKLEYSNDDGATWHTAETSVNINTIFYTSENTTTKSVYYLYQESAPIIHLIRIKTRCADYKIGPTYSLMFNQVCRLVVSNVQINSNDDGQGGRNYVATWVNSAIAFDYDLEVSMDGGANWISWPNSPFTQGSRLNDTSWSYTFGHSVDESHKIRVKPLCNANTPGTFGEGTFN